MKAVLKASSPGESGGYGSMSQQASLPSSTPLPLVLVCTQVIDTAAAVLPILALSLFGDGMNCVLSGVLRGAGRQALGAALNLSTFWCMGLPLAGLLAFKAHLGITGLWAGLAATTMVQVGGQGAAGLGSPQQLYVNYVSAVVVGMYAQLVLLPRHWRMELLRCVSG